MLLTGCATPPGGGGETPVLGGQVVITAPRGYCPDPSQRRDSATGAFLLFGTCQGIEGAGPAPAAPAVLTAAVAPGAGGLGAAQMAELATLLGGPEGRATLSRSTGAAHVSVTSLEQTGDLILIRARDADTIDLDEEYWRAIFPQSGALVTLTASGTATDPLDAATGRALILDFVRAVQRASPKPTGTTSTLEEPADTGETKGLRQLLNHLL
ncbi:MAG: hypothetical protein VX874_24400 [Pseudomonadota bacterium]|nr:hypothetical protein [Pseudomonadota bacterium]